MNRTITIILIVAACFASNAFATEFMLEVQGPERGYLDHSLGTRLEFILSGINGFDLVFDDRDRDPYALANYDLKARIRRAVDHNVRYLVLIDVVEADSKIKSSTLIPAVFKAHKRKYRFEAEVRVIDSKLEKIVSSERFSTSRNGSRALAYLDLDASAEPALAISHPKQIMIYADMEEEIAEKIADNLIEFARSLQPKAE